MTLKSHLTNDEMTINPIGTPFSGVGIVVELEAKYTRYPQFYILEYSRNLDKYISFVCL